MRILRYLRLNQIYLLHFGPLTQHFQDPEIQNKFILPLSYMYNWSIRMGLNCTYMLFNISDLRVSKKTFLTVSSFFRLSVYSCKQNISKTVITTYLQIGCRSQQKGELDTRIFWWRSVSSFVYHRSNLGYTISSVQYDLEAWNLVSKFLLGRTRYTIG